MLQKLAPRERMFGAPLVGGTELLLLKGGITATEFELLQEVGHAEPEKLSAQGYWADKFTGIASEWSVQFSGYFADVIDSASKGVQRWLQKM
ncbi:hypothetical protein [Enterobacter bugandensis]|uniref:hypothetical protein n=1 Tax=Enterobacter bugandensis TaxID=881260 RepID=UPI00214B8C8E|nr:hypothetical protein [Enterobacter bugandensis]